MKKILLNLLLFGASISAILAQAPLGFNYQAVVRNSSGEIVASSPVGIQISILQGSTTGNSVYSESFNVSTNEFGLINLTIGQGQAISGTFSTIDWSTANFYLKVELDVNGGTNYIEMGTSQLLSVPFANYAFSGNDGKSAYQIWLDLGNVGSEDDFINSLSGPSGTSSWADQETIVSTDKKVGVGTATPAALLEVQASGNEVEGQPLFEVKNSKGETVFAVYENSVKIFVDEETTLKTAGGFAVSGRTSTKETKDLLTVSPGETTIYVDEPTAKTRGGFAVSGRTTTKEGAGEILMITPSLTQFYVDETALKTRGGFAVSGRTTTKEPLDIFHVTPEFTRVYVDEPTAKTIGGFAVSGRTSTKTFQDILTIAPNLTQVFVDTIASKTRGGFAVSGRTTTKEPLDILHVTPDFTRVYVDEESSTKTIGGFAVSGRTSTKETGAEIFRVTSGLTEVFVEEASSISSKTRGGFAVSGRTSTKGSTYDVLTVIPERTDIYIKPNPLTSKNLPEGFSISGLNEFNESTELFAVSEQGTFVATALAVAPKVTTQNADIITQISAIGGGEVLDNGGSEIMMRGIVYSSVGVPNINMDLANPSVSGIIMDDIGGMGIFSGLLMEFLTPGVKYNVRAFATNIEGLTGYGAAKEFTTLPPSTITFNVQDNLEQPITNAVITLYSLGSPEPLVNAPGVYTFKVPDGVHNYDIEAPGYDPLNWAEITVFGDITQNVYLTPSPVKITFIVKNQYDELIPDVSIEVLNEGMGYTDETGTTSLNLYPGIWNYTVTPPEIGFSTHSGGEVTVVANTPQTINVTVTENPKATFNVTDTDGNPVSNVEVEIYDGAQYHYAYVFNGIAVIYNLPPGTHNYTVNDWYDIYSKHNGEITVIADQNLVENVILSFAPKYIVTFSVTDDLGNPIEGAEVYLNKNYGEPVKGSKEQYFYGFTNADGKIVFADVTEGDYNYDVYYGEVWDYSSVTINQNMQIDVVLVPPPSYTITFDVSDITTSLPIEGAEISLYVGVKKSDGLKEYYNEIRTTIADGTAVFEGVPEGNYYYYDVFHANYFSSGDMLIVDADKIVAVQLEPATKSKK